MNSLLTPSLEFEINCKPFSINKRFTISNKRFITKTTSARNWERALLAEFLSNKKRIENFKWSMSFFKDPIFYLEIDIEIPLNEYYTKKGMTNKRTIDCSNVIKPIEDSLSKALGIDDSLNAYVRVKKIPTPQKHWSIKIAYGKIN